VPTPASVPWFPVVGAAIGAGVGGVWWAAAEVFPTGVAAAVTVVAALALTGMLHVDGLADSADGLLPHLDRDRRLAVMATPDVGAFGVAVGVAALLLQVTALASMQPDVLLVVGACAAARALVAVELAVGRYARGDGLAGAFAGGGGRVVGVGVALGVLAAIVAWDDALAVVAGVVAGAGVLAFAHRRIGGYTGDVLGATIVVTETVALVLATVR
jgi:adenosylcobinamide-GDP ribazoletransferase